MTRKILLSVVTLTLAWMPLMAQTQLVAPNEVCLFDGKHYVSDKVCFRVEPEMRHKLVPDFRQIGWNDRASSIRVGVDVEAWIFEHPHFAGGFDKLAKDDPSLGNFYNESSALMVVPIGRHQAGAGATLTNKIDATFAEVFARGNLFYGGDLWEQFFPLPEDSTVLEASYPSFLESELQGKADYLSLSHGVEAELYRESDFAGGWYVMPGQVWMKSEPKYKHGIHTYTLSPRGPSGKTVYSLAPYGATIPFMSARSIKVRPHKGFRSVEPSEVLLCKHRGYVGPCHSFKIEPGSRHKLAMKLEAFGLAGAKSIAVGADVEAWLFGGKWFDAPRVEVAENNPWLKIDPVSLVVHPHRGGNAEGVFVDNTFFPAPETENQWSSRELWDLNDKIDKVRLCGSTSVTLYEHVDFDGKEVTLPGFGEPAPFAGECHSFNLDTWGFKDKASSYKARMQPQPAHPGAYKITLKTGDEEHAGTDAGVWVTLIGDQAAPQEFPLDTTQDDRERGQADAYWVSGHPVGQLQAVRVRHDNKNDGPGWLLEEVRVQELASLGEWIFKTDTWLSKDRPEGIDQTFTGPEYKPKVHQAQVPSPGAMGAILGHAQAQAQQQATDMWLAKGGVYNNINFPGRDLTKGKPILLAEPSTYQQCAQKCEANTACESFTYVRPRPDRSAECWLKKAVPPEAEWVKNPSCVSGVRKTLQMQVVQPQVPPVPPAGGSMLDTTVPSQLAQSFEGGFEYQINRPGGRYRELLLDASAPALCAQACLDDVPTCRAFTYFQPGSPNMPKGKAYCSLKDIVPAPDSGQPCCISGVVSASVIAKASAGPAAATTEKASTLATVVTPSAPPTAQKKPTPQTGAGSGPPMIKDQPTMPPIVGTAPGSEATPGPASEIVASFQGGFEYQTNRPGGRYKELLDLQTPELCAQACLDDLATCRAFTWFTPGSMVRQPGSAQAAPETIAESYCSLKSTAPPIDAPQPCCVSGVVKDSVLAARIPQTSTTPLPPPGSTAGSPGSSLPQPHLPPAVPPPPTPATPATEVFSENFDDPLDAMWQFVGSGMKVENQRLTCEHADGDPTTGAVWSLPLGAAYTLTFEHTMGTGMGAVAFNTQIQEPRSSYRLWVSPDELRIARQGPGEPLVVEEWLGWSLPKPGDTHAYRIEVSGGQIDVYVNNSAQPYISWIDPQPVPPGVVAFGCGQGTGFAFDNITVIPLLSASQGMAIPINIPGPALATLVRPSQRVELYLKGQGHSLAEPQPGSRRYRVDGFLVQRDEVHAKTAALEEEGVALFAVDGHPVVMGKEDPAAKCMASRLSQCSTSKLPAFTEKLYPDCFGSGPLVDPCEPGSNPQSGDLVFLIANKVGDLWDGFFYCAGSGCLGIGERPGVIVMDPELAKKWGLSQLQQMALAGVVEAIGKRDQPSAQQLWEMAITDLNSGGQEVDIDGLLGWVMGEAKTMNEAGSDDQLANIDLQNMLQQQQQQMQMMSAISKMLHDTAMAVIRKTGG